MNLITPKFVISGYNLHRPKLFSPESQKCYFFYIHKQICLKVPILLYFVRPKRPSGNCSFICFFTEKTLLPQTLEKCWHLVSRPAVYLLSFLTAYPVKTVTFESSALCTDFFYSTSTVVIRWLRTKLESENLIGLILSIKSPNFEVLWFLKLLLDMINP